ncbi:MAG: ATP-binding protein [bacterium]
MRTKRRIALSGPPCGGKSTCLKALSEEFGDLVVCVPEIASFVIGQAELLPSDDHERRNIYIRTMQQMRIALEDMADSMDRGEVVIVDRGVTDGAAYLEGGMGEFEGVMDMDRKSIHDRYDLALLFDLPTRDAYEENRRNNPARFEDYDAASVLRDRTVEAWLGHPDMFCIHSLESWEEKLSVASDIIERYLALWGIRP